MISVKNLSYFLKWLNEQNTETYCRFSNGYIGVNERTCDSLVLYVIKEIVVESQNWSYEVLLEPLQEKRIPCSWRDILNGVYSFTTGSNIQPVKTFKKSDNNRKLYKGFSFLPKISSDISKDKILVKIMML
jgi:hypothetical protein